MHIGADADPDPDGVQLGDREYGYDGQALTMYGIVKAFYMREKRVLYDEIERQGRVRTGEKWARRGNLTIRGFVKAMK
ncbi:hypothetical protein PghCCS26_59600 [Paenibacillus glycanilyticus]|uniref:Uncharacterized protein n=1 Tax=Paenibacillus glycanilyticus TaxID=126569 RepID=A0ABQ6NUS0_9BACL|nr:hypothetical protein PghCCS26_59600 [Paenibacillus glycanilyticus]